MGTTLLGWALGFWGCRQGGTGRGGCTRLLLVHWHILQLWVYVACQAAWLYIPWPGGNVVFNAVGVLRLQPKTHVWCNKPPPLM